MPRHEELLTRHKHLPIWRSRQEHFQPCGDHRHLFRLGGAKSIFAIFHAPKLVRPVLLLSKPTDFTFPVKYSLTFNIDYHRRNHFFMETP